MEWDTDGGISHGDDTGNEIDKAALRFTRTWYGHSCFQDKLSYRGVNIAEVNSLESFPAVLSALVEAAKKANA